MYTAYNPMQEKKCEYPNHSFEMDDAEHIAISTRVIECVYKNKAKADVAEDLENEDG